MVTTCVPDHPLEICQPSVDYLSLLDRFGCGVIVVAQ
ncbi:MAG: hypothetical protein ACI8Z1_003595 [Candidatus Azotimanducaceae bacterium]